MELLTSFGGWISNLPWWAWMIALVLAGIVWAVPKKKRNPEKSEPKKKTSDSIGNYIGETLRLIIKGIPLIALGMAIGGGVIHWHAQKMIAELRTELGKKQTELGKTTALLANANDVVATTTTSLTDCEGLRNDFLRDLAQATPLSSDDWSLGDPNDPNAALGKCVAATYTHQQHGLKYETAQIRWDATTSQWEFCKEPSPLDSPSSE